MSYNIRAIEILKSDDFHIDMDKYYDLMSSFEHDAPESSIFDRDWLKYQDVRDNKIYPKLLWWQYSGSGNAYQLLRKKILPQFSGSVDLLFVWEDGKTDGIRLENGVVTRREVVCVLGDEIVPPPLASERK